MKNTLDLRADRSIDKTIEDIRLSLDHAKKNGYGFYNIKEDQFNRFIKTLLLTSFFLVIFTLCYKLIISFTYGYL